MDAEGWDAVAVGAAQRVADGIDALSSREGTGCAECASEATVIVGYAACGEAMRWFHAWATVDGRRTAAARASEVRAMIRRCPRRQDVVGS
ncbi:hypothetical protein [uncultured Bifidobacterium sp.]|uniref:hypothetical protein n=1 Tax=uncultured Bifidobacterium sp. TaxID=165187 RepID=UPI0028DBE02D|nr:hypothetical protein [uncultured Bifidobacterium sp.]